MKKSLIPLIRLKKRGLKLFFKLSGRKGIVESPDLRKTLSNSLTIKNFLSFKRLNSEVLMEELNRLDFKILNDGTYDTYYINPSIQINYLEALFSEVRVFSLFEGSEITNHADIDRNIEPWLYFLCKK